MAGTRKWQMTEILWILAQYRANRSRVQIFEAFHKKFPKINHVVDANSIRYVISTFKDHPEFNQLWDAEQISYILGRYDAGNSFDDVAIEVGFCWPFYVWAQNTPRARCIEFVVAKYKDDAEYNRVWTPEQITFIRQLQATGTSSDMIIRLADHKWPDGAIWLNDIRYLAARYADDIDFQYRFEDAYEASHGHEVNVNDIFDASTRQFFASFTRNSSHILPYTGLADPEQTSSSSSKQFYSSSHYHQQQQDPYQPLDASSPNNNSSSDGNIDPRLLSLDGTETVSSTSLAVPQQDEWSSICDDFMPAHGNELSTEECVESDQAHDQMLPSDDGGGTNDFTAPARAATPASGNSSPSLEHDISTTTTARYEHQETEEAEEGREEEVEAEVEDQDEGEDDEGSTTTFMNNPDIECCPEHQAFECWLSLVYPNVFSDASDAEHE